MFPQLCVVGYDVMAGPFHVPRYDLTEVDEVWVEFVGAVPIHLSRPKQAVVASARISMSAVRRYFMFWVSVPRGGDNRG
jgi:hypothetical protein